MTTLPRAVLWDMDGTLIDSGELHFVAWHATLRDEGHGYDRDQHTATFGMRNDAILRRLVDPNIGDADIVRIADAKEAHYREQVKTGGIELLPGVQTWLERLKTEGWRMAVASSAPPANLVAIMEALDIEQFFDAMVSGEDVPQGKPDPAIFLHAAERLGVPAGRCIVVEDAPAGVEAGRRAGMRVIGVGPNHAALIADRTVERLDQLPPDTFDQLVRN